MPRFTYWRPNCIMHERAESTSYFGPHWRVTRRVDSPLMSRPAEKQSRPISLPLKWPSTPMALRPTPTTVPLQPVFLLVFKQHIEFHMGWFYYMEAYFLFFFFKIQTQFTTSILGSACKMFFVVVFCLGYLTQCEWVIKKCFQKISEFNLLAIDSEHPLSYFKARPCLAMPARLMRLAFRDHNPVTQ